MDANLVQPRASNRAHSPHQLDRQVVKEIQLGLGIDDHQPIRFGHLRGNFREVLGACHPDRDWKAKLCAHTTTYCSRDLRRRTEKVGAPRNVSKGLVDGNAFILAEVWRSLFRSSMQNARRLPRVASRSA